MKGSHEKIAGLVLGTVEVDTRLNPAVWAKDPRVDAIKVSQQDIFRDEYLDVLTWRFFGDFERQAIYDAATLPVDEFCVQRGGQPARFALTANCRNAPRIVELIRLLDLSLAGGLAAG